MFLRCDDQTFAFRQFASRRISVYLEQYRSTKLELTKILILLILSKTYSYENESKLYKFCTTSKMNYYALYGLIRKRITLDCIVNVRLCFQDLIVKHLQLNPPVCACL